MAFSCGTLLYLDTSADRKMKNITEDSLCWSSSGCGCAFQGPLQTHFGALYTLLMQSNRNHYLNRACQLQVAFLGSLLLRSSALALHFSNLITFYVQIFQIAPLIHTLYVTTGEEVVFDNCLVLWP